MKEFIWRFERCKIYVSCEPCTMCMGYHRIYKIPELKELINKILEKMEEK